MMIVLYHETMNKKSRKQKQNGYFFDRANMHVIGTIQMRHTLYLNRQN